MVSIETAQTQVSEAKTELQKAQVQVKEREKEISSARVESRQKKRQQSKGTIAEQLRISKEVGKGGVAGELAKRRRSAKREFRERRKTISQAERDLGVFETQLGEREKEIVGVETQITSAKAQRAEQQSQINLTSQARKLIAEGKTLAARGDPGLQKRIRELQGIGFATPTTQFLQPTISELQLQASFPEGFRKLSVSEIGAGQSLIPSVQTLLPPPEKAESFIFLKPSEISAPLIIGESDLTAGQRRASQAILLAEDVLGVKESGTRFGSGKRATGIGFVDIISPSLKGFGDTNFLIQGIREGRKAPVSIPSASVSQGLDLSGLTIGERFGEAFDFPKRFAALPERGTRESLALGTQLQSALFLSFVGVRAPKGILKVPTRKLKKESFLEAQFPVIIRGRPAIVSSFRITREITPPIIKQSQVRGLLGISDLSNIQRARTQVTITPFKVLDDLPTLTLTTKGGQVGRLDVLTGSSTPVTIQDIGRASPTQQLLFRRFAESRTGLSDIRTQDLSKIVSRDLGFDLGTLRTGNLGRIDTSTSPSTFDLFPQRIRRTPRGVRRPRGIEELVIQPPRTSADFSDFLRPPKGTTSFETLSQFTKVKETDQFQVFIGSTFFKASSPFARATGKTLELPGAVIRARQQIVIGGEETGVQVLRPVVGGKRTPLDRTFQQFSQQPLQLLPKPPPRPRRKGVTLKGQQPRRVNGIGSLLFGVSSGVSAGQFTGDIISGFTSGRLQGLDRPLFQQVQRTQARQDRGQPGQSFQFTGQLGFGTQTPFQFDSGLGQGQLPRQVSISSFQFKEGLGQIQRLGQVQRLGQEQRLGQIQRLLEGQRLGQEQRLTQKQRQKLAQQQKLAQKQRLARPGRLGRPPRLPPRPARPGRPSGIGLPFDFFPGGFQTFTEPPKRRRTRKKIPIQPSFTGIITGGVGLPETTIIQGIDVGVLPRTLRGLPRRKKAKKSKKK